MERKEHYLANIRICSNTFHKHIFTRVNSWVSPVASFTRVESSIGLHLNPQDLNDEELEDRRKRKATREAREIHRAANMVDKGEVEECLATLDPSLNPQKIGDFNQ